MKKRIPLLIMMWLILCGGTIFSQAETSTGFRDTSKITHSEAVTLMSTLGIIQGYEDGYFYPNLPVTRAEMAKMVALILQNGQKGSVVQTSKFSDVQGHWAEPYIVFCTEEGIVAGKNASTFAPNATVTGTEAAKMLLGCLGYDAGIEGFTGSSWEANVQREAKKSGLMTGIQEVGMSEPLDRDAAAQMIFNALQTNTVEYQFDLDLSMKDHYVTVDTESYRQDQLLFERQYGTTLKKIATANDEAGVPTHRWMFEGETVGTYENLPDYTFTTSKYSSVKEGLRAYDTDIYALFYRRVVNNPVLHQEEARLKPGDRVEIYRGNGRNEYVVLVYDWRLIRITAVDNKVSTEDQANGVRGYLDVDGTYQRRALKSTEFPVLSDLPLQTGTVLGVVNREGSLQDAFLPEAVTGELTGWEEDRIEVDGLEYPRLAEADFYSFDGVLSLGQEVRLYLVNGCAYGATKGEGEL